MLLTEIYKFASDWFINPVVYLISTLLQSSFLITLGTQQQEKDKKQSDLFPPSSQFVELETEDEKVAKSCEIQPYNNSNQDIAKPCSTSTMSMFIPVKNEAGEYEFKLANGSEENLIPFSNTLRNGQFTPDSEGGNNQPLSTHIDIKNGFINLSPVSSVKSTDSNNSSNLNTTTGESGDSEGNESSDDVEKVYQCDQCDSKFKCKSYLTRHVKKHSDQKAFRCPFYKENNKCHQTGGFSRRDTFKTHLKSRHFEYPPGIKSNKRTGMMGWCGICGEKFLNNEIWVERHIDMGLCPGLPQEYIKTLKIGKKKTGKHSKFLDVSNVDESIKLGIQSYGGDNGGIKMSPNMYLQSPSSVNSSPSNVVSNNIPIAQTSAVFTNNTNTSQISSTFGCLPVINGNPVSIQYPMDAETIALLQKQQELTNIIIALKRKQEEAESRTLAAKQHYEQQIQNQLQYQMKQAQIQQQLMQLQQVQGFQQLVRPQYLTSFEDVNGVPTPYTDMSSTFSLHSNSSNDAKFANDATDAKEELESDEEYPSLE
ncbi:hypothetical protein CANINC_003157 [Pichia inconspicua]|uniref:C2H2-type domain-containing protein n=1 Tax=Pichia inconspicua TaxID=52247 RepID=A0A4T0WZF0_9ASCO|nr:hypothetical protein CANINC_003157 [[Candida] inconspicua]